MLDIIESLSLISLLILSNNSEISIPNKIDENMYTEKYIINKISSSYSCIKLYELEFII
jgi:hypothetical protein